MNLTEVVVKEGDTFETLAEKVKVAAILGTLQSKLTYFPYLRKIWQKNTEEERLLGVSLTGIMDNPIMFGYDMENDRTLEKTLTLLKQVAIDVNAEVASSIGINPSVAITCVKPSGTVSQLVNSSSGIHARHNDYYIRTVRCDNKDPFTVFMKDVGIPNEPEFNKPDQTTVFSFPVKAPENAILRDDLTAIEQLELWSIYQEFWCEHKPSITVSVRENEWPEVGGWVYNNFDIISGVSFLPFSDHTYKQAPYQDCTQEEYEALKEKMPKSVLWSDLAFYEKEDNTSGMQTLACSSDLGCEIVDLV